MAKNGKKSQKIAKNCEFENNFSLIILNLIKAKNAHNIDCTEITFKSHYFIKRIIQGIPHKVPPKKTTYFHF